MEKRWYRNRIGHFEGCSLDKVIDIWLYGDYRDVARDSGKKILLSK